MKHKWILCFDLGLILTFSHSVWVLSYLKYASIQKYGKTFNIQNVSGSKHLRKEIPNLYISKLHWVWSAKNSKGFFLREKMNLLQYWDKRKKKISTSPVLLWTKTNYNQINMVLFKQAAEKLGCNFWLWIMQSYYYTGTCSPVF